MLFYAKQYANKSNENNLTVWLPAASVKNENIAFFLRHGIEIVFSVLQTVLYLLPSR